MQEDLFGQISHRREPLASRMRPRSLKEYIGQEHILSDGKLLKRAIQADQFSSLIFYGPPGTGKTTLAQVIANHTKSHFMTLNAVLGGVKDIRIAIDEAKARQGVANQRSILFIDEVHRFNKSQQDALLPHVENGTIIFIGATTENPFFEVNKALVSRSKIFELKPLSKENLLNVVGHVLSDKERGYGTLSIKIEDDALEHLVAVANGDARNLLNALELAIEPERKKGGQVINIDLEIAEESIRQKAVLYDKDGDAHYDIISAFIKSIRGSDSDAALYWMAKMIHAGEDPRFIFRRMIISASEDIGLAAPNVLSVVMAAAQAYDYVGLPEGQFHLTHACLALCNAPKSNSTLGYFDALNAVKHEYENDDVPNHLKDKSRDGDELGHGHGYKYPHAFADHWVAQQYLPDSIKNKVFYQPSDQGYEKEIYNQVEQHRELVFALYQEQSKEDLDEGSWMERTFGNHLDFLKQQRDILLEVANLRRDDLVLDFNAGSGLLSFECLRQVKIGGVVSCCHSENDFNSLELHVENKKDLHQLQLYLIKQISEKTLKNTFKEDFKFNTIFIRNLYSLESNSLILLNWLKKHMVSGGSILFCYPDHQKSQRLSSLVPNVNKQIETLEELYFNDEVPDCLLSKQSFLNDLQSDFKIVQDQSYKLEYEKYLSMKEVNQWFSEDSPFGSYILKQTNHEILIQLKEDFQKSLKKRKVNWKREFRITTVTTKI